jgi:hypothetical protein
MLRRRHRLSRAAQLFNSTKTNLVPQMALSPCGRAGRREAGCVKHQADAPHTVKHLLDLRCQVSAGLLQTTPATKTVSAMYALDSHNLLL